MENKILKFECDGIDAQGKFCLEYTGYGQNTSPEFVIENLSPAAKNIIKRAIPSGENIDLYEKAKQGLAYGWHRYAGPKPPKGKRHLYRFTVYALDCEIDLPANAFKNLF